MTPEQIQALQPAFANYLRQFFYCCGYTQTFDLLNVYCRGLLSDLQRKTCEPIALLAGVAVRTLQEFLRDHVWHHQQVRDLLQQDIARLLPTLDDDDLGTIGISDETATVKKGTHTPGVQRQWCGERGKLENCIVTVHAAVARGRFHTLVDADLFLPQDWDCDRQRCRDACIPDTVRYRSKWRIALEQFDRLRGHGVCCRWWTFDEGYGGKPGFLHGLEEREQCYIGEVPRSFRCHGRLPRLGQRTSRADDVVRYSPVFREQPWQRVRLARQTLGEQEWEVKAAQVWLPWDRTRTYWLLWARNARTGEEKYFVSNASPETSVAVLMRVAFQRWPIEHSFRVSKGELGFRHYEGRSYVGLMRHLTLCLVTMRFAAGQADRLRGEKSGGDAGAGLHGVEPTVPGMAGEAAWDDAVGVHVVETPVLSVA